MEPFVLYRKYRPKNFDEVVGQGAIVKVLKNAVNQKKLSHAYLFTGKHGTGKTTVARILAKAVNCFDEKNKPCNTCAQCEEFNSGKTLDLVEIDAASNRGIDEVRALKEAVNFLPFKNRFRVYIVDEVHMLTREAFNALLKTLEEPPKHIIFILATTSPDKLPQTIISRTEQYHFKRIPEKLIAENIFDIAKKEKIEIAKEAVWLIGFFADGSLRDAHGYLGKIIAAGESPIKEKTALEILGAPSQELVQNLIKAILEKKVENGLLLIRSAEENNLDAKIFTKFLLRIFRYMYLLNLEPDYQKELKDILGESEFGFISENHRKLNPSQYEMILINFLEVHRAISTTAIPYLPLELALYRIISKI